MGKRYRPISGYWAFDLLFRRLHRNWGEFFLLELFVDDEVVDVPPIEPVNQSYKYQVLQTVVGRGLGLDQSSFFCNTIMQAYMGMMKFLKVS